MTTTSADLDAIAARADALKAWDQSVLADLYSALQEPFQTIYNWTLAPYQPGVVTDNLYRLRPRDWKRSEGELGMEDDGTYKGATAGFALWENPPGAPYPGLTKEIGNGQAAPTLALAMLSATAKVWSYILQQAGR